MTIKEEFRYLKHYLVSETPTSLLPTLKGQTHNTKSESKLIVDQQMSQFVEQLYLENWYNIKRKKIYWHTESRFELFKTLYDLNNISNFK